MRRTLLVLGLVIAVVMLLAPVALAEGPQPTSGANSADRNEAAVFEGPHCHTNEKANQDAWDEIWVFPSHNAHLQTNQRLGGNAIFAAIPPADCPES